MTNHTTKTLAIETSCDDTSLALVSWDNKTYTCEHIISYSQIEHQQYWWVVPEIASRLHEQKIISVLSALEKLFNYKDICCISVTATPWLPWSLLVGKTIAHMLSLQYKKPLQYVNHIHGHIYSAHIDRNYTDIEYPALVLTVSGWHNNLYYINKKHQISLLWTTLDDAAWEAFDKVSRMLWWPYPWWPRVSEQAQHGVIDHSWCKRLLLPDQPYHFSFSGIKSSVYTMIEKKKKSDTKLSQSDISMICATFQDSVAYTLSHKVLQVTNNSDIHSVMFVWWVSANKNIRSMIQWSLPSHIQFWTPTKPVYCTDNAAMIWVVWLMQYHGIIPQYVWV